MVPGPGRERTTGEPSSVARIGFVTRMGRNARRSMTVSRTDVTVPEELRCKAVVAVASGGPESCEVATELDVDPSAVGKLEAADARPVRGEDHDRTDHEARKA